MNRSSTSLTSASLASLAQYSFPADQSAASLPFQSLPAFQDNGSKLSFASPPSPSPPDSNMTKKLSTLTSRRRRRAAEEKEPEPMADDASLLEDVIGSLATRNVEANLKRMEDLQGEIADLQSHIQQLNLLQQAHEMLPDPGPVEYGVLYDQLGDADGSLFRRAKALAGREWYGIEECTEEDLIELLALKEAAVRECQRSDDERSSNSPVESPHSGWPMTEGRISTNIAEPLFAEVDPMIVAGQKCRALTQQVMQRRPETVPMVWTRSAEEDRVTDKSCCSAGREPGSLNSRHAPLHSTQWWSELEGRVAAVERSLGKGTTHATQKKDLASRATHDPPVVCPTDNDATPVALLNLWRGTCS